MTMTTLAVDPNSRHFGRSQENALREHLERTDLTSDVISIGAIEDVEMRPDGTLGSSGYRPTTWCLQQLCRAACQGLYQVLLEITSTGEETRRLAAIGMLNQLMRFNFTQNLHGSLLLLDRSTKTVEAMVSASFRFLPNRQFYEHARSALTGVTDEVRFLEADLRGRWLMLRYYSMPPVVRCSDGMSYHAGWHFSNHECGQAAVRATAALIRNKEALAILLPSSSQRLPHRGARLLERMQALMGEAVKYQWSAKLVTDDLARLTACKLNLSDADEKLETLRRRRLTSRLAIAASISRSITARVVAIAIQQAYIEVKASLRCALTREAIRSRTGLDLLAALCREAKTRDVRSRESLEQLAWKVMTNRFKL